MRSDRISTDLVVNRTPFGVDDHVFSGILSSLLALGNGSLSQLGDRLDSVDVCTVGSGTKDGTNKGGTRLVRSGQEGSNGVVDEGGTPNRDVLAVEGVLQELDDVVTDGVLGSKSLGPGEKLSLVQSGLLDGETVQRAYKRWTELRSGFHNIPEGKSKVDLFVLVNLGTNVGQERVDRVGNVI